jgi:transcriptional regulator with XRE-family HTH domain
MKSYVRVNLRRKGVGGVVATEMMPRVGPTVRRLRLGRELRRLREAAGVNQSTAAAAIGCSLARIGHIERGRNPPSKSDLVVLVRHVYGGDEATLETLEVLRAEASKRGWWSTYGLPEWLAAYVGLEDDALALRSFDIELIPGLLQTENYIRHLLAQGYPLSQKEIDRRVAARLERQKRLTQPEPLQLIAILGESALERCCRDRNLGSDQLTHLVECAQWDNVDLRVLPFDAGVHVASGPYSLLTFPEELLPPVAWQEYAVGGHIVDEPVIVDRLTTLFSELHDRSLGADESQALIAQLANTS